MVDYREILRLDNLGYTKKDIASSVHSSRNTVSEVLTLAGNLHVCWPLDDDVTNQSLESLFYPGRNKCSRRSTTDGFAEQNGRDAEQSGLIL